jgi:hypothetical protein
MVCVSTSNTLWRTTGAAHGTGKGAEAACKMRGIGPSLERLNGRLVHGIRTTGNVFRSDTRATSRGGGCVCVCRCIASAMNGFGALVFIPRRSDPRSVRVCPNHHFHPVLLSLTFSRTVNRRTTSYRGTPYLRTLTSRFLVSSSCSYHDASKHTWSRHERHQVTSPCWNSMRGKSVWRSL